MPLFGGKKKDKKKKKKDKKKKKKKDKKKKKGKEPPPKAPEPPKEEVKPDYYRTSVEEMGKVERQIDYFVDRRTKSGLLDRYREKYGEDLEAPEGLDGYHYEYVVEELPEEEGGVDLDKEIVADEGEGVGAEAAPAAKKEKKSFWGSKKEKKPKAEAAPKEKAPKEEKIKEPSEPLFDPDRFITPKSVVMCIFVGKPLFPVYGIFRYKISMEPKPGWIKAFIVAPDIIPLGLALIWRGPARLIYEAVMWGKRSKARREEREAAKKEEEPATA